MGRIISNSTLITSLYGVLGFDNQLLFRSVGSTNWVVPDTVSWLGGWCLGGGGGGASSSDVGPSSGAGGGASGCSLGLFRVVPGETISITVGAGGAVETNGGTSSIGSYLSQLGGSGATDNTASSGSTGTLNTGGAGGAGVSGNGGGGGGGATTCIYGLVDGGAGEAGDLTTGGHGGNFNSGSAITSIVYLKSLGTIVAEYLSTTTINAADGGTGITEAGSPGDVFCGGGGGAINSGYAGGAGGIGAGGGGASLYNTFTEVGGVGGAGLVILAWQ